MLVFGANVCLLCKVWADIFLTFFTVKLFLSFYKQCNVCQFVGKGRVFLYILQCVYILLEFHEQIYIPLHKMDRLSHYWNNGISFSIYCHAVVRACWGATSWKDISEKHHKYLIASCVSCFMCSSSIQLLYKDSSQTLQIMKMDDHVGCASPKIASFQIHTLFFQVLL